MSVARRVQAAVIFKKDVGKKLPVRLPAPSALPGRDDDIITGTSN